MPAVFWCAGGLGVIPALSPISAVCNLALQVYVGIDAPYLHFQLVAKKERKKRKSVQYADDMET